MSNTLKFENYTVAWIAVLPIEAEAALGMLDKQHLGQFESVRGDDYLYIGGEINRHNVVVATWPEGQNYGVGSAAALVNQVKARFPNIWFALLVGVAAGLPNLNPSPPMEPRDIRLGDVLVCESVKPGAGIIHYDLGKDTEDGFLLNGRLADTPAIVRAAIGNIKLTKKKPFRTGSLFSEYLLRFQQAMEDDKFLCRNQQEDQLFTRLAGPEPVLVQREPRDEAERTRVWYGNIGSGNSMMRNSQRRDELRDKYNLIGLEMEASGIMNTLPTGVIRGVCDYGDSQKNKDWQPYAAAVAAAYAKGILYTINPGSMKPSTVTYWYVPFGKNKDFIGRKSELQYLSANLDPGNEDDCQRVAISGLGGIGKTQIALEAVFQIQEKFPDCSMFWVPAIDVASFERAYREIGQKLEVPGINDDRADIKLLVKTFLSQEKIGRWLMVIDNADDLKMLFNRASENDESSSSPALISYLPFSRKGSILFTTRNHQVAVKHAGNRIVKVGEMSESESQELFENCLVDKGLTRDKEVISRLLDLLSNLPLAIKQAAAFLNENLSTSVSDYLELYNTNDEKLIELLSQDFEDHGRYQETKNPVASTWWISFRQIQQTDKLAARYLYFMSCVAQQDIPYSLLPPAENLEKAKSLGLLKAYKFITERVGSKSYDMHRLVQLAARNWLKKEDNLSSWSLNTLERLAEVFPFFKHEKKDECTSLLPHTQYVLEFQRKSGDSGEPSRTLLFSVGEYFLQTGKYLEAERMYRQTLKLREDVLGHKHPDTLNSIDNLTKVLRRQGKYEEAETMLRQTLELKESLLGYKHPDTLSGMNKLAIVLCLQGKYEEAETMLRQTLELRKDVIGYKHPNTLDSINNLAEVLRYQGKYREAETMLQQALELKEDVLGYKHPDTLGSMENLAKVLCLQGKYEEAEMMHRRTIELKEEVLGNNHPDTLDSMNDLAEVVYCRGRYEEAEIMLRQILQLNEDILGHKHPNTLSSIENLAIVLRYQGKHKEAETIHRQTLELREDVLGYKHPDTLNSIDNLAIVLYCQGNYKEARTMLQRTLELKEDVLGYKHPFTLDSMNNLAEVLRYQREYEEAETMHRRTLQLKEDVLGYKHPSTLNSMNSLAEVLHCQGKHKVAETIHRRTLQLREDVLGYKHPDTLSSMNNLVKVLDNQGRHKESEAVRRSVMRDSMVGDYKDTKDNESVSSIELQWETISFSSTPPTPNAKPAHLSLSPRRVPPGIPIKPPYLKGAARTN